MSLLLPTKKKKAPHKNYTGTLDLESEGLGLSLGSASYQLVIFSKTCTLSHLKCYHYVLIS